MRGHGLDTEWPEQERQDERRSREAVVDDEPEAPRADRLDVEAVEQVLRVGLAHPRRIADRADVAEADAAELAAREVLLDLLLERRRELDARLLEELDLHDFRIGLARADVEAGLVALGLQQVARDRRRQHPQVGDVEPGRRQAR